MNPYQQRMDELESEIVCASQGVQPLNLSEEEIASAENELGHRLPDDYRRFLRDFGCHDLYAYFPVPNPNVNNPWVSIGLFLGITPSKSDPFQTTYDLLATYRSSREYLPVGLISIATSSGPNRLCLSLSEQNRGAVFWWDRMVSFDSRDGNAIYFVASSFDEFMLMLRTQDQYEEEIANT